MGDLRRPLLALVPILVAVGVVPGLAAAAAPCTITKTNASEVIHGTSGDDVICAMGGNDVIYADGGNDTIYAGDGNDTIYAQDADDTMYGEAGNDRFFGGAGSDAFIGGDGSDTADYSPQSKAVTVTVGTTTGGAGNDGLNGGAEGDDVRADVESVRGGAGNDDITGGLGNDVLLGGKGKDKLSGRAGADRMIGGPGADTFAGGSSPDTVDYSDAATGVTASIGDGANDGATGAGEGDDVGNDVEYLQGSAHDDVLTGNGSVNILYGGLGDDDLHGGAGNDQLLGGLGADDLDGGNDVDVVSYADIVTGGVKVTVGDAAHGDGRSHGNEGDQVRATVERVIGTKFADDMAAAGVGTNLRGYLGDDTLIGNVGPDVLDGQDGDDIVEGGGGIDAINGGVGDDALLARDGGTFDQVDCGTGSDSYDADTADGIDVNCETRRVYAVDDTDSTNENTSTGDIDVLANDDGDGRSIVQVDNESGGTVALTSGGTRLAFTPSGFDHLAAGDTDSGGFDYTISGAAGNYSTAHVAVAINGVNDAPRIESGSAVGYTEDDPPTTIDPDASVVDVDDADEIESASVKITNATRHDDDLLDLNAPTVNITGAYAPGTGVLTLTKAAGSHPSDTEWSDALANVTFENTGDDPGTTRSFLYTVGDGTANGTKTRTMAVTATNDPPDVDTSAGATPYTEGDAATPVDPDVTLTDPDSPEITEATARVSNGYTLGEDVLALPAQTNVVGVFDPVDGELTISPKPGATPTVDEFRAALASVTYQNLSQSPPASKTISFTATDDDGATSAQAFKTIAIEAVNDAPEIATGAGSPDYVEDAPAVKVAPNLSLSDPDSLLLSQATVSITSNYAGAEDVLEAPGVLPPGLSASYSNGVLTISGGSTPALYQSVLRDVTYKDTSQNPSTATRTISFEARDADNATSNTATKDVTVTAVNDAPVANDETFNNEKRAVGNTSLVVDDPSDGAPDPTGPQKTVDGDILGNDTDVDNSAGDLSVTPATNQATTEGGKVTIQSDGDFTFLPDPVDKCTKTSDSFDYTVTDGDKSDTGTVSVAIADCVWYVDASAGAGDGTSQAPFNTLSSLNGAGGAGDSDGTSDKLFLYPGTYTGGLALEGSQKLLSQRHGLEVDNGDGDGDLQDQLLVLAASGAGRSTIAGGLDLANGNEIQGIDFGTAAGRFAIAGTNVGTTTINSSTSGTLNNASGPAIKITGTTQKAVLDAHFASVSSSGGGGSAIDLEDASGTFESLGGTILDGGDADVYLERGSLDFRLDSAISDGVGQAILIQNQTGGTKDFNGAISNGGAVTSGNGIKLDSNTGTTRFDGTLTIKTLNSGALAATNAGTLAVTGPASTLTSDTGTPLTVTNTTIGDDDLAFRSIASNGAANGINVSNTTNPDGRLVVIGNGGTCTSAASCTGGAIQNATGAGVNLLNVPGGASLTRMSVSGSGTDGIRADNVGSTGGSGVGVANGRVINNGDAVQENGLDYDNVKGTSSIDSTTVTGNGEFNARWDNDNGTALITVSSSTFSNNSTTVGADGLLLYSEGNAVMKTLVQNSTLAANRDDALQLLALGDSSVDLTFNNNTVSGAGNAGRVSAQAAINYDSAGTSDVRISHNGGTVGGSDGSTMIINPAGSSQFNATIDNVTLGTAGVPFSGSATGIGIWAKSVQTADAQVAIKNSHISGTAQNGIQLRHNDNVNTNPAGTSDFTVTGNTIRDVGTALAPAEAIYVQSASLNTDKVDVCADIGGSSPALENDFAGQAKGGLTDIAFSRRNSAIPNSQLRLPGYDGSSDLTTYVGNRNVGTPSTVNFSGPLNNASGVASCQQPTAAVQP
ncbi:MAG TPA: Ig-like domain-containing protein [Solirubrobacteraceae bacterium]|jgi:Ca2+-binding RTX toxin-like protein